MDRAEILNRLLSAVPDTYDKSEGSFFYDTLMPVAIELEGKYKEQDGILSQGFVKTATGEYLDKKVYEQGLVRKSATYATGKVKLYGNEGTQIQLGAKVASDSIIFSIAESAVIGAVGFAVVSILCDTPGSVGNLPAGSIKNLPVTLAGISSVLQENPTSGGYDAETDEELRQRYFDKVTKPATSGNKWDYYNWAMEVSGVGGVKVLPLDDGPGTVKVIIVDSNKEMASPELIAAVAENIEMNRPVGANITVESALSFIIPVEVTVNLANYTTVDVVKPKITEAIEKYLKSIVFEQNYISYAKVGAAVLSVPGVIDYTGLKLQGAESSNITFPDNIIPVLGAVTVA